MLTHSLRAQSCQTSTVRPTSSERSTTLDTPDYDPSSYRWSTVICLDVGDRFFRAISRTTEGLHVRAAPRWALAVTGFSKLGIAGAAVQQRCRPFNPCFVARLRSQCSYRSPLSSLACSPFLRLVSARSSPPFVSCCAKVSAFSFFLPPACNPFECSLLYPRMSTRSILVAASLGAVASAFSLSSYVHLALPFTYQVLTSQQVDSVSPSHGRHGFR